MAVGDAPPSTSTRSRQPVLRRPAARAPERVGRHPQPGLEPPGRLGGLGADAEVDGVDDHPAGVVDEQVHPARLARQHQPRGGLGVERQAEGAGEVVAGAERDQAERPVRQLAARPQPGHGQVQAAVAAGHDEAAVAAGRERGVELLGGAGGDELDGPGRGEDGPGRLHRLLVGAAGVGAGQEQVAVGGRAHGRLASFCKSPGAYAPGACPLYRS